jgi:hypothetical protein
VRSDVLRAVLIKIKVFWDMMLCCTLEIHHFRGTCCLHYQGTWNFTDHGSWKILCSISRPTYLSHCMLTQPRRPLFSHPPPWQYHLIQSTSCLHWYIKRSYINFNVSTCNVDKIILAKYERNVSIKSQNLWLFLIDHNIANHKQHRTESLAWA